MITMTLTESERVLDAMALMFRKTYFYFNDCEPSFMDTAEIVESTWNDFCRENDIVIIDDDEDFDDIPDDVDETNYNPYMGCDEFDDVYLIDF